MICCKTIIFNLPVVYLSTNLCSMLSSFFESIKSDYFLGKTPNLTSTKFSHYILRHVLTCTMYKCILWNKIDATKNTSYLYKLLLVVILKILINICIESWKVILCIPSIWILHYKLKCSLHTHPVHTSIFYCMLVHLFFMKLCCILFFFCFRLCHFLWTHVPLVYNWAV